jgi:N-acetylneuraminic acid mutarotase
VIGGYDGNGNFLPTVESYNPATNTWTEETRTFVAKGQPAAGQLGTALKGFTIVAADGTTQQIFSGDTEGYDATTNTWRTLATDPTPRVATCFGSVGQKFYDVGGEPHPNGNATNVNESYTLSTNTWKTTLAPIPHATMWPFSAVYMGKVYCIGGRATASGIEMHSVQIYQP